MRWKGRRISTNVEDRRGGGRAKAAPRFAAHLLGGHGQEDENAV